MVKLVLTFLKGHLLVLNSGALALTHVTFYKFQFSRGLYIFMIRLFSNFISKKNHKAEMVKFHFYIPIVK